MAGSSGVSSAEIALTRKLYAYQKALLNAGTKELASKASKAKTTPKDTGALAKGIGQVGLAVESTDIESVTKNQGFDYPAFIDKVAYIRPTRAKFLHFFYRGREVFSKGFPNRHTGWWAKVINQKAWTEALTTAQKKVKWPA